MKIVGLTGGIGSGKTTVSKCFEQLGIPVFYADTVAKDLYNSQEVVQHVIKILGVDTIHTSEGILNRALIADIIFRDQKKLNQINELLHPLVKEEFFKWMGKQNAPYCIREAAILIESGSYKDCDSIIVVVADIEIRVARVMKRESIGENAVRKRILNQLNDEERAKFAQHTINNNGSIEDLQRQVNEIHKKLS